MYSAFRVRLLNQAQALPSLVLSRPFSHAGVYVHFLRFIWLFTCWFSTTLILKGNSLVFYFYAKKRCQWIFSTNTIYCRALFSYNSVVINVFKGEKFINNHKRIIVHLIGSIFNLYFGYCKNGGGFMYVYDTKAIREMDQYAAQQGLSLFTLMENAGRGIAESLQKKVHKNAHILI